MLLFLNSNRFIDDNNKCFVEIFSDHYFKFLLETLSKETMFPISPSHIKGGYEKFDINDIFLFIEKINLKDKKTDKDIEFFKIFVNGKVFWMRQEHFSVFI